MWEAPNGIKPGDRVIALDAPNMQGEVIRCDFDSVDVLWDNNMMGCLIWDRKVAHNAYRLQAVKEKKQCGAT